jgi:HAD superfamily hydrolase (TIGR01509 family)
MLPRPKAVIFDLDGTLLDTERLYSLATQEIVDPYGKTFDLTLKRKVMGGDARVGAALVINRLDLPLTVDDFLNKRAVILKKLFANSQEIVGAGDFLAELSSKGIPLALATSSNQALCQLKLSRHRWKTLFSEIVCGDNLGLSNPKPAPDIFLMCARALKQSPYDCVVFEDSVNGITAAVSAGMSVVAIESPYVATDDLSGADVIIENYQQHSRLFAQWA